MVGKKRTASKKVSRFEYESEVLDEIKGSPKKTQDLSYKINIKFKNQKQKDLYDKILNKDNRVIIIKGSPGTGKTIISLMAALNCLADKTYSLNKILISKLIVPAGRDIGFLKGDLEEKTAPYFTSYWANIKKLVGTGWSTYLKDNKIIEESLINYMRGDTFGEFDASGKPMGWVAILDEAQNTSTNEMKTFVSRLGENSKLIILGDTEQVDIKLNKGEKTGLDDIHNRFKNIDGVVFVEFNDDDIVRDKFLIEIMKRYKDYY